MKDYFKLTVEAQDIDENKIEVDVKIDGVCDCIMTVKALYYMLNQLEHESKDELHEAFHLFLSDRGF